VRMGGGEGVWVSVVRWNIVNDELNTFPFSV